MFRIQEKVAVFFSTTICLLRIFHGKLMNLRMIILHHLSGAARGNSNLPKNHYSLWWKTFWVEKLDHHQLIFQVIVPFQTLFTQLLCKIRHLQKWKIFHRFWNSNFKQGMSEVFEKIFWNDLQMCEMCSVTDLPFIFL